MEIANLPVGFCLLEVPVCKLLQETNVSRIGQPGKPEVKRTHRLFIDDFKVYQESHNILKDVRKAIIQTSHNIGTYYGVVKYAEIISESGKMVKEELVQVLQEKMKSMDPDQKRCINS